MIFITIWQILTINLQQQYEASKNVLNEGLEIAENNYENLYFKNAYTELYNS